MHEIISRGLATALGNRAQSPNGCGAGNGNPDASAGPALSWQCRALRSKSPGTAGRRKHGTSARKANAPNVK